MPDLRIFSCRWSLAKVSGYLKKARPSCRISKRQPENPSPVFRLPLSIQSITSVPPLQNSWRSHCRRTSVAPSLRRAVPLWGCASRLAVRRQRQSTSSAVRLPESCATRRFLAPSCSKCPKRQSRGKPHSPLSARTTRQTPRTLRWTRPPPAVFSAEFFHGGGKFGVVKGVDFARTVDDGGVRQNFF